MATKPTAGANGKPTTRAELMQMEYSQRMAFLATADEKSTSTFPNQTYQLGSTLVADLPSAGIVRWLQVNFSVPVTITGPATPSPKAPFNLFSKARLVDDQGVIRVDASPFLLKERERLLYPGSDPSNPDPYGRGVGGAANYAGLPSYEPQRYNVPAVAAGQTLQTVITGSFMVPCCLNASDPRGAFRWYVPGRRPRLELDVAPQLWVSNNPATVDAAFTGAGGGSVALGPGVPVVNVGIYYWEERGVTPNISMGLYEHEVRTYTDSTNITPGQEQERLLTQSRIFHKLIFAFVEAGALSLAHVARWRMLYTASDIAWDEYQLSYLSRIHRELRSDPTDGIFYLDLGNAPKDSGAYGQLRFDTTFAQNFNNSGTTYIELLQDSLKTPVNPNMQATVMG